MVIGIQLHKAQFEKNYDAIIIGSGMSGLATAVCLAKSGQKVIVLERHYTAGGFTHTYQRKGFEWDVGLHYVGEVHRPWSSMRRMFDFVSGGKLQWQEMDAAYDKIYLGSECYHYLKGEIPFRENLIRHFPEERAAITAYIKLIKSVHRLATPFFAERALPLWLANLLHRRLRAPFLKYARQTTAEVLSALTRNEQLIAVLTGQWGDYGLPPSHSSFAVHALVAKHYLDGANYPVGGSASIARTAYDNLKSLGGEVVINAEVKSLVLDKGAAAGVVLADGRVLKARRIISSIGVENTVRRLLPEGHPTKLRYQELLKTVSPSFAHFGLYIGLKGSQADLGIDTGNLWLYPDAQHDRNVDRYLGTAAADFDFPVVYVSFPSGKDPAWNDHFPGKSTVEVVVPAPYAWFENWVKTRWRKRGEDYEALKREITARLLDILEERVPGIKGKIVYTELSTPLSTVHFSNYPQGEIYGLNHTPKRFEQRWLRTDMPIKNLFLTGQDIVTCGVGGALAAGFLTAIRILGPLKSLKIAALMQPLKRA